MKKNRICSFAGVAVLLATLFAGMGSGAVYADRQEETLHVFEDANDLTYYYRHEISMHNTADHEHPLELSGVFSESDKPDGIIINASYKPNGLNAALHIKAYYGTTVVKESTDEIASLEDNSVYNIGSAIVDSGAFVPYEYDAGSELASDTKQYYDEEYGVICAIQRDGFICGHINWIDEATEEWTGFLNGIGAAWKAKYDKYPTASVDVTDNSALPEIKNSAVSPYQYVVVGGLTNAVTYFYRSSPTSDWVFFNGFQDGPDCDLFTGEAEKGFAGSVCYDYDLDEASQVGKKSGLLVPDTGANTIEGIDGATPMAAIATLGLLGVAGAYIYKAKRAKEHFIFG